MGHGNLKVSLSSRMSIWTLPSRSLQEAALGNKPQSQKTAGMEPRIWYIHVAEELPSEDDQGWSGTAESCSLG